MCHNSIASIRYLLFLCSTITPLLKHELWASIIAEMEKDPNTLNNKIRIAFNDVNLEKRGTDERFVYHCEGMQRRLR